MIMFTFPSTGMIGGHLHYSTLATGPMTTAFYKCWLACHHGDLHDLPLGERIFQMTGNYKRLYMSFQQGVPGMSKWSAGHLRGHQCLFCIIYLTRSDTRCNAGVFASMGLTQWSPVQHPHCLNSNCSCAHLSIRGHVSLNLMHRCHIAILKQQKAIMRLMKNVWPEVSDAAFHCFFKGTLSRW